MTEHAQPNRYRCLVTGCNPVLGERTAALHTEETGHRTAKWPVRSKAGQKKAKARNRSGYYDRYNVGAKSAERRGYYNAGGGRSKAVGDLDSANDPYDEGWTHS